MKYSKRIKTYHGIPVPPWRHNPMGKSMTMVFVIEGRIPSKKNELVAVVDRADAFAYINSVNCFTKKHCITAIFKTFARIKNSKEYEKWELDVVEKLIDQQKHYQKAAIKNGIVFPLSKAAITIKFYWKGKYRRDNSNKSEGIHDALVKACILADDSDKVIPDTNQEARDYSEEVTKSMAVIYITTPIN